MTSTTEEQLAKAFLKPVNELKACDQDAMDALCRSIKDFPNLGETLERIEKKLDAILEKLNARS